MFHSTGALASVAFTLTLLTATDAMATGQRTFVASTGNDVNPCSLALPCRGFAAAITQTNSGGEVIVLDSAGYGTVTIYQSVSIIAPPGVYAGIFVSSTGNGQGVAIAGSDITVVLRGLTITGTGVAGAGITIGNAREVTIEDCVISNISSGVSAGGTGTVNISRTVLRDTSFGIIIGEGATAIINGSQVLNSSTYGILNAGGDFHFPSESGPTQIFLTDTVISGTGRAGLTSCVHNSPLAFTVGLIVAKRVTVTACQYAFENQSMFGAPPLATMTVSDSLVTGNSYGFFNAAGVTFQSLGNNHVSDNTADTTGTITTIGAM